MMINCKECGHRLSDKADHCPNCGAPMEVAKPPAKPIEKKKKWWEKDCNGWKVGTYISAFLFMIFFIAYLTTVHSPPPAKTKKKINISIPLTNIIAPKNSKSKDMLNFEKKKKEFNKYYTEVKNANHLSYMKIMKICKIAREYDKILRYAKISNLGFENNTTIMKKLLIKENNKKKKIFIKLRKLYCNAVREKFMAIQRCAVGGDQKNKIIIRANIFSRKKEIEKFHKLILPDLITLKFIQVIYSINKDNAKGYVFNIYE